MSRENSRWTYTAGSRPEGCIVYDDDSKLHSHHDTDPARGQQNAFDLVRLHRFGHLDANVEGVAVTDRPSYRAMVEWAHQLPEIAVQRAGTELEDLGPVVTEEVKVDDNGNTTARFAVHSASEFSSGPAMEWIVRGLLPRAELAFIFGEPGSGKSFVALDVAAAITRGVDWRGRRTAKGRVVYVCAEGASGFKARLRAYAREHKVDLAEFPLGIVSDAPNLLEPKDTAAITKTILDWAKGLTDVIVLDTMAAVSPGSNENSAEDVGRLLQHCKFLHRETGALVILVAHSGKDQSRGMRGWSGAKAAADAEIEVTRNGDYRQATTTKLKDSTDGETFAFKLKVIPLGLDADGEEESSCVVEHVETAMTEPSTRRAKLGPRESILMDLLKTMAPSGTVDREDLIEGYKAKTPKTDGRDQRRGHAISALTQLIAKRAAFMHGDDRVSLTSLITSDEHGWLE